MRIRYCIVTLNQLTWVIDEHLPSLDPALVDGVHVYISEVAEQTYKKGKFADPIDISQFAEQLDRFKDWKVSTSLDNFGVANSWNYFIEEAERDGYDAVIVANDDIYLYVDVLSRFVEKMQDHEFVCFEGQNAFSFFGIHTSLFNKVGRFDEAFWPAYFEDNDYHYRMKLLGLPTAYVEEPSYYHRMSATLTAFDFQRKMMHHHNFRKNTMYYQSKWGGMPHEEEYTIPFGDQDVNHGQGEPPESAFNRFKSTTSED
jgi:GT2 family glycosyltransferase